ncbi:DUF397 domain-containing protein [Saccharothrix coeruleofusca]|uniref:DUF397 domain-containing protein n=1 Tax=Saccharothrix coeruleofusca TaxID=33919 RepID=A0A918AMJ7_9PSEU|nr:DUF397 domain-containing protein [Saccharothrix coeruleofusca]GGP59541.1 DUF397 domain-containing protein [Saccharothrix coeruleofusca]
MSGLQWFKSSYSANNGDCVEVAFVPGGVMARDSKNPQTESLRFSSTAWRALLGRLTTR